MKKLLAVVVIVAGGLLGLRAASTVPQPMRYVEVPQGKVCVDGGCWVPLIQESGTHL
jgi:hypothetical protein